MCWGRTWAGFRWEFRNTNRLSGLAKLRRPAGLLGAKDATDSPFQMIHKRTAPERMAGAAVFAQVPQLVFRDCAVEQPAPIWKRVAPILESVWRSHRRFLVRFRQPRTANLLVILAPAKPLGTSPHRFKNRCHPPCRRWFRPLFLPPPPAAGPPDRRLAPNKNQRNMFPAQDLRPKKCSTRHTASSIHWVSLCPGATSGPLLPPSPVKSSGSGRATFHCRPAVSLFYPA